jgi:hypothetical protein
MRMHLAVTDYGNFLQNEPSPLRAFSFFFSLEASLVHCGFALLPLLCMTSCAVRL